jgi:hypothetical protein
MRVPQLTTATLLCTACAGLALTLGATAASAQNGGVCPPYPDGRKGDPTPLFNALDANHDGKITREEWVAAGAPEPSWKAFNTKETVKKNGYITLEDFLNDSPPGGIDTNCDGKFSLDEFLATKKWKMGGPPAGGGAKGAKAAKGAAPNGAPGGAPGAAPGGAPGGPGGAAKVSAPMTLDELRTEVERQKAVLEIENIMSRHAYYYSAQEHLRELAEIWDLDAPDVSFGQDEGYSVGKDSIIASYIKYHHTFQAKDLAAFSKTHPQVANTEENLSAGTHMFHTNSTPVIEIAKDGKTAKGLWYSIGQVTMTPGGKQDAQYMWERYGVDFIKVNGKWKIWHLLIHTDISTDPGGSWVEGSQKAPGGGQPAGGGQPGDQQAGGGAPMGALQPGESSDKPKPDVANNRDKRQGPQTFTPPEEYPLVPMAYETFTDTFSYGAPGKSPDATLATIK